MSKGYLYIFSMEYYSTIKKNKFLLSCVNGPGEYNTWWNKSDGKRQIPILFQINLLDFASFWYKLIAPHTTGEYDGCKEESKLLTNLSL